MHGIDLTPLETPISMPSERHWRDRYVYVLLLSLAGLWLAFSGTTSEFVYDPYYFELARSLLAKTGYGFNFRPEPMIPPGFPALLAVLILGVGHSYAVLIRSMSIFTIAGLIAAYQILKAEEGPAIAGVVCVLFASSPIWFEFSTRMLFSDMPYFFTSMLLIWALPRLDSSTARAATQVLWWALCALLMLTSILVRSTGIALVGGIGGWLVMSSIRERRFDMRRLAIFIPLIVLGVAAEGAWLSWSARHPVALWPVHGFQESYVAQLKLKSGNDPELGMATWRDVIKRPLENEDDMVTSVAGLLIHKQVAAAWYSPITVIPLALLLVGLGYSFRNSGGGIAEWYFVSYQFLYLFWPWNFELRFQLPVAPLAALYLWRGGLLCWHWIQRMPRAAGAIGCIMAAFGILSSTIFGWRMVHPRPLVCIAVWLLAAGFSAVILAGGPGLMRRVSRVSASVVSLAGVSLSVAEMAGAVAMIGLLAAGVWMQMAVGVENLRRVPEMNPNIEAAKWIRGNSPPDAVVMARWESLVYHYSGHRVIWFPASSDPELLMTGIRRHHVRLIVVSEDEDDSYWKPSDTYCFRELAYAYPMLFQQVHKGAHERVYEVASEIHSVDGPSW